MKPVNEIVSQLDALLNEEDFPAAKALLYGSVKGYLAEGDTLSAIGIYNELMGFERQYGSNGAAVQAADAALALLETAGMAVSKPAAMITLNAATVYKNAGREHEARALYDTAETLFGRFYPAGAKDFAGLWNNRASVYLTPAEFPKAEYYYTRALQLLTRLGETNDLAVTYLNLAGLYLNWPEHSADARAQAETGLRILNAVPAAKRDGYYYYTCRKCAAACRELGFPEFAADLTERADRYYAGH